MKFPNAAKGVSQIFTAEILALIAAIVGIIGSVLLLAGVGASDLTNGASGEGFGIAGILSYIVVGVLMIISFIMNIVGVGNAGKDEGNFKKAMIAIIVGIVMSIVSSAFSNNEVISLIAQAVGKICELLVTWFCISGIRSLASQLGNSALESRGAGLQKLICVMYIIAIIATILSVVFQSSFMVTVAGIMGIISAICSIIAYIVYLSLLSSAKKMLLK